MKATVPVVFINCSQFPYIDMIMLRRKVYETRSRRTLDALIGRRVYLAETGDRSGPIVRCSAVIRSVAVVRSASIWQRLRPWHCVPAGCAYDWTDGTKVKYMYELRGVRCVAPFRPAEGKRHGRVWMETEIEIDEEV